MRKDAARGKLTYPGLLGIAESRRRAERLGREARSNLLPLGAAAGHLLDLVALVLERELAKHGFGDQRHDLVAANHRVAARPSAAHRRASSQLLAQEMRDELVRVLSIRPAHFASNLGVVELCLALHLTFDFCRDRLIWDTGHQIYPHKLITGRYRAVRHHPHHAAA